MKLKKFNEMWDPMGSWNPKQLDNQSEPKQLDNKSIEEKTEGTTREEVKEELIKRMKEHKITFAVTREDLRKKLVGLADPRFGARPAKRYIEETCENLITQKLLN